MSRASGASKPGPTSLARFFPHSPAVLEEKKRLARDRNISATHSIDSSKPTPGDPAAGSEPSPLAEGDTSYTPVPLQLGLGEHGDRDSHNEEVAGDLLNAVGSASSLASNHSSTFSNGAGPGMPNHHGAGVGSADLTPATTHESSPPDGARSPPPEKGHSLSRHINASGLEYSPISPRSTRAATPIAHNLPSKKATLAAPTSRANARPQSGVVKGKRVVYDPELDPKPSKDQRKRGVTYREFGKEERGPPPSDPRLAIPGYKSGQASQSFRPAAASGTWKFRPRPAPYTIGPYQWDTSISVGPGPPTSVVVTGFNPFTSDAQLRAFFSSFGEIAEVDNRTDPSTGTFLGVCLIRYRDSRGRGDALAAAAAAKRAEKEGTGQRIGTQTVRVERDRTGKRCKRYADSIAKKNSEQREEELRQDAKRRPPPPHSDALLPPDHAPAPPPNAPKGPSARPTPRAAEIPRPTKPVPLSILMSSLIEAEPILSKIKRKPYIFISQVHVPVMGTTIPHLKKRLKTHRWEEVRCDTSGYYIIFEDHKRGEDEARRCFEQYNNRELFTYNMVMECQQYGNPNYERSPSPERVIAQQRQKEEDERTQRENEMDIEEEKKQRAANMDPVEAAMEQLRSELKDRIMGDIKTRIGAPALHNFLDPNRHRDKRQKLGIADPSEQSRAPAFLSLSEDNERRRPTTIKGKPLYASSITRLQREEVRPATNAFLDERRQTQKKPKRKVDVRPLHQRLQDFYGEDDSDDEHRTARGTEDQESQTASRVGSVAPSEREDGSPYTPRKRRRIERSETPHDEDSGDEGAALAKNVVSAKELKKETEDMKLADLLLIVKHLPPTTKLYKQAKAELAARKKAKEDDHLFREKADEADPMQGEAVPLNDILESTEVAVDVKSKKPKAPKKKTKKQLFEEREAAKAAAEEAKAEAATAADVDHPMEEDEGEGYEEEEEEERGEVEWGLSTDRPRRTVEDNFDEVLDVDGWQHLLKDNEDVELLREALADKIAAPLRDVNLWAQQQKAIKLLNNGSTSIRGYYIPNASGSARTEGYKKILESEKSKYLPHRIKVANAREKREAELTTKERNNPVVAAEAAKLAKLAGNASSRSNRANNRTAVKDITHAKQNLLAEGQATDSIRFNQLKKRKKLVKFDRSAIHGWGLYAEQNISASDMIIEYVGEKVRQAVANIRELRYDKQGMGSSYLFRIDDDTVVDATKKGGIARFINHSCAPNCTAKIVRVDDTMRIAIYAKTEITKGDELTYDYKFERESDSDMRVPCLCGSEVCKGFLN